MKIKDVIARLNKFDPELTLIMASDAEGNSFAPLGGIDEALYIAEADHFGTIWAPEDEDELPPAHGAPALILYPI